MGINTRQELNGSFHCDRSESGVTTAAKVGVFTSAVDRAHSYFVKEVVEFNKGLFDFALETRTSNTALRPMQSFDCRSGGWIELERLSQVVETADTRRCRLNAHGHGFE
jgi:hypothetical protein